MSARKKTKKVAKKKVTAKKKVAKKATRKPATSRKKAAKKSLTKKKVAKKKASRKKAAKKKVAKKKASRKKTAKKKVAKKKVAKKTAKTTTTGKPKKKTMGKVTNIKKSPTQKIKLSAKKKIAPHKQRRKNEDYMGAAQTAHFRGILLAWKTELMREVDRTVNHMQDDATNFPDPNDRASQEEEFALELRTRDRERKLISKIDESITMLDSGDYGFCEICGIEIGVRRLEARPTATQCIDCKTLDEIKERHLG